jgi:hypothetical protein
MNLLEDWENFYVIVGSSAGALIGLQFVVVTLMADMPIEQGEIEASGAFTTPSVVHFAVVLLLSAIASIPWDEIALPSAIWGLVGFCGTIYTIIVARRLRRLVMYKPVFEDWLFHALLPFGAYAMITAAAAIASTHEREALFLGAGAAMLLLFIGVHNAWDLVTHLVFIRRRNLGKNADDEKGENSK